MIEPDHERADRVDRLISPFAHIDRSDVDVDRDARSHRDDLRAVEDLDVRIGGKRLPRGIGELSLKLAEQAFEHAVEDDRDGGHVAHDRVEVVVALAEAERIGHHDEVPLLAANTEVEPVVARSKVGPEAGPRGRRAPASGRPAFP